MGELLAALELEGMGYETSLVDAPGYDLIVNYNDRPLRIQVKSGHPFARSEEHTSELQSLVNLVCRLLLEKKNTQI